MRQPNAAIPVIALCLFITGCQRPHPAATTTAESASTRSAMADFAAAQQQWRDERRAQLTRPDGWASLIGLHWIEPGAHYLGSDADNGIRLAMGPAHLGMIELKDGQLRFVRETGVPVMLDGVLAGASVVLQTDDAAAGASALSFDGGRGLAGVIKRGERYALRVKHAEAPTRTGFARLDYWPATMDWQVAGKFVPHARGATLAIANIIGTTDDVPNPGAIEFTHGGRVHRLEALDEGGEGLFLVFADRTSGHDSYGAGRFLDIGRPDAAGRVTLDFNRAYNPPCAFTAFATCPLPPAQNRLDLAIEAGEKTYHAAARAAGTAIEK